MPTEPRQDTTLSSPVPLPSGVPVPVIASGGAGHCQHIHQALTTGKAEAALLASLLHYGQLTVKEVKDYLHNHQVTVRNT